MRLVLADMKMKNDQKDIFDEPEEGDIRTIEES